MESSQSYVQDAVWLKSSFCDAGQCVEVAPVAGAVLVRSSLSQQLVGFNRGEWTAFVAGVKAGEFDLDEATDG